MPPVRSILCPTDFSEPAHAALAYAVDIAKAFGARITLLHVVQPTAYPLHNLASISGFPNLRDELKKGVDADMAQTRTRVPADLQVDAVVRDGVPHEEIIAAAAEHGCDLIVMATHGHTGLKHALLGSNAERVVRLSPCPVLTLRNKGH
ncbi:MAG: universal stress protein [Planctomycetota bacterium]